jgi:hypothetical protein
MASGAEKINTSLGEVNRPERRSFGREYITLGNAINEGRELVADFLKFLPHTIGARRFVMRGLLSEEAIKTSKKIGLPIEAGIPMDLVTGNQDGSAIVYIAKNNHKSPRQGENPREYIKNRKNGRTPLERARSLDKNYIPVNNLKNEDANQLFNLWERFGWTRNEITNFIVRIQNKEPNLWFSGIRDTKTDQLVSVCNAEAIEFAGIKYIETTEYSTDKNFENQSLSTTAVSSLIAQVLRDTFYDSNRTYIPVITAEFNTSSTSPAVGASAGFIIPEFEGTDGILSYNVAVYDNSPPNSIFANSKKNDRGIQYSMLRDFALAVLPINNIQQLYPPETVQEIINLYQ